MSLRHSRLIHEAEGLRTKGRFHDAAVVREQALRIAQEYKMENEIYSGRVWSAHYWEMAGNPNRAMSLLIDARSNEPIRALAHDKWVARKRILEIGFFQIQPDIVLARKRLDDLIKFHQANRQLPLHDLPNIYGKFFFSQGDWRQSLEKLEVSWTKWDGSGYVKWEIAVKASVSCLHLARLQEAQEWCRLLELTERHLVGSRLGLHFLTSTIALYCGKYEQAIRAAERAEQVADTVQYFFRANVNFLRVRTFLLNIDYGDPILENHPSRFRLAQELRKRHFWNEKFERLKLLVDYRLATVRYVVGMQPVDDLWYQQQQIIPTQLPTHFDYDDYNMRVFRTKRAIRRATQFARWIDESLQCDFRVAIFQERAKRLNEIEINVEKLKV